jgi:hypothetical protein
VNGTKSWYILFTSSMITFVKHMPATSANVLEHCQGLKMHLSAYTNEVNFADMYVGLTVELSQYYS